MTVVLCLTPGMSLLFQYLTCIIFQAKRVATVNTLVKPIEFITTESQC